MDGELLALSQGGLSQKSMLTMVQPQFVMVNPDCMLESALRIVSIKTIRSADLFYVNRASYSRQEQPSVTNKR